MENKIDSKQLEKEIWELLENVSDPEIPVISVVDLGVVRSVTVSDDRVVVIMTPTYSGCPAIDFMKADIEKAIRNNFDLPYEVISRLSPAWTTDWMSEKGKQKLEKYGIAPPKDANTPVQCPRCKSFNTQLVSQFGSTACKANYQCLDCKEPFEHFKCHK